MAWFVLLVSAVFEAVWATALGASDGFREPGPTAVFLVAVTISMLGLGWAARSIPIGTAYAVWTGLGAVGTLGVGAVFFGERLRPRALALVGVIIALVVALKVIS